jgi:hypothetical protein
MFMSRKKRKNIFLAKTQKRKKNFSQSRKDAKAVSSSPVSGEAGRGNKICLHLFHFSFSQKRKKHISRKNAKTQKKILSQRLLAPLPFQERPER